MDKNLTLAEMLEVHSENSIEMRSLDMANLTTDDQNVINDYVAVRQLLQRAGESLEFVLATTVLLQEDINVYSVASVMEKAENLKALSVLTNNGDESFIKTIYKEGLHSDLTIEEQTALINSALDKMALLKSANEFEQAYEQETASGNEITVTTLTNVVNDIQSIIAKNDIPLDKISESSEILIEKMFASDSMYIYENVPDEIETREELNKQDDELVIVEGNDGGVIYTNMTPELAARRPDLLSKYESIVDTSGDYVTHYTVEETTTDMSRVGGDVKYEAVNDIGTIERGQGELNHEEKQAIVDDRQDEILAEQQRQQQIAYQEQLRLEEERRKQKQAQRSEESKDEIIAGMIAGAMAAAATVSVVKEITPVVAEAIKEAETSEGSGATKPKTKNKDYDMER